MSEEKFYREGGQSKWALPSTSKPRSTDELLGRVSVDIRKVPSEL
jgi:hypothetical protein